MKKYKLIKTYPYSPKLGTIAIDIGIRINFLNDKNEVYDYTSSKDKSVVTDYPEFWQEIIEKDYEILSFKKDVNIYTVRENGRLLWDIPVYKGMNADITAIHWSEALNKDYKIHSIKRLSDGEVFTIGDKVCGEILNNETIHSIILKNNSLKFNISETQLQFIHLNKIQHIKQPLFITEDGVDIYYNENVYSVDKKTFRIELKNCGAAIKANIKPELKLDEQWLFSTKEAADEYVALNKPCLSINEVNRLKCILFREWDKYLLELVKQKLK